MVADYFLPFITPYEEIQWLCNVPTKGMSVYSVSNVAVLLGLQALPIRVSVENFLSDFSYPLIAFIKGNHFVVLSHLSRNCVHVNDPSNGVQVYSITEFREYWYSNDCGVLIVISNVRPLILSSRIKKKTEHNGKRAIILFVHNYNEMVKEQYDRLRKQLTHPYYEVFLLYSTKEGNLLSFPDEHWEVFHERELNFHGYSPICKDVVPGSTHIPLLNFYFHHNQYAVYWYIEYDVIFTGKWDVLMNDCDISLPEYDFLSCHLEKYNEKSNKMWPWWYLRNRVGVNYRKCIKGFNPICRYSNRALACLDEYMKQGHSAHSEVMITTCLYHHGLKIGDIGGRGEFVPKGWEDRYYLAYDGINNGTMRYRPEYTREEIELLGLQNKLFHPLKR